MENVDQGIYEPAFHTSPAKHSSYPRLAEKDNRDQCVFDFSKIGDETPARVGDMMIDALVRESW